MHKEALLYKSIEDRYVNCRLCSHYCRIAPGKHGLCGVRKNTDGKLYTLVYGDVIASHADPIEKKPLYHFFPGTRSFSVATPGCNFKCSFCQNWDISQLSKKDSANLGYELKPEEVIRETKKHKCKSIAYTYTEPTIFFEYALDVAGLAKKEGICNVFVTNGYMSPDTLKKINPYLDACNVDLKSFSEAFYREMCGAGLKPVLGSIKLMKEMGIWIEITTLLISGKNDSDEELKEIASFIVSLDRDIPWHVSRFHPDYKYTESMPTPPERLRRAKDIGKKEGLNYIYLGNVLEANDTQCPSCGNVLIEREMFDLISCNLKQDRCAECDGKIAGLF